ncbi:hypothetical protein BH11BAC3_BH11BAC3_05840 [soil metagenome]
MSKAWPTPQSPSIQLRNSVFKDYYKKINPELSTQDLLYVSTNNEWLKLIRSLLNVLRNQALAVGRYVFLLAHPHALVAVTEDAQTHGDR